MADAPLPLWVRIQEQTFLNWVNFQLAKRDLKVDDLTTDFSDGVRLVALLEILAEKSVGKTIKQTTITSGSETTVARRAQYVFRQNIEKALNFCTAEGIRLENVGAIDIVEGNRSIILGLVWSLIMHYQIQPTLRRIPRPQGWVPTAPKHQLLEWVQSLIGMSTPFACDVSGFNKTWNNGKFLSALVESQAPGTLKDWATVYGDKIENLDKCKRAVAAATDALGVPAILSPQHLASPECDELSLVTYLSGFYTQLLSKSSPTGTFAS